MAEWNELCYQCDDGKHDECFKIVVWGEGEHMHEDNCRCPCRKGKKE